MYVPPWVSVTPDSFLAASQAGANLGAKLAQMRQEAALEQQRLRVQERMQQAQLATQRGIASMEAGSRTQEGQAKAQAQAAQQEANRQLREWEANQKMAIAQEQLQRLQEQGQGRLDQGLQRIELERAQQEAAAGRAGDTQDYRNELLDLRREGVESLKQQRADTAEARKTGFVNVPLSDNPFTMNPGYLRMPAPPGLINSLRSNTNLPAGLFTPGQPVPSGGSGYDPAGIRGGGGQPANQGSLYQSWNAPTPMAPSLSDLSQQAKQSPGFYYAGPAPGDVKEFGADWTLPAGLDMTGMGTDQGQGSDEEQPSE